MSYLYSGFFGLGYLLYLGPTATKQFSNLLCCNLFLIFYITCLVILLL